MEWNVWMRRGASMSVLCALALCFCGCDDLDPGRYDQLDRPRILGVKADPQTIPADGAELSALVWTPEEQAISYTWRWCPYSVLPRDNYACPITREVYIERMNETLTDFLGEEVEASFWDVVPPFEIGASEGDEGLTFAHGIDGETAEIICFLGLLSTVTDEDALELQDHLQSFQCEAGFEIDLIVEVEGEGWSQVTKKSVFVETLAENPLRNPSIQTIEVRPSLNGVAERLGWEVDEEGEYAWRPLEGTSLPRGNRYEVRAVMDPDAVDTIVVEEPDENDPDAMPIDPESLRQEFFDFGWYADRELLTYSAFSGTFPIPNEQEDGPLLEFPNELDLTGNLATVCPDAAPCQMEIILVVRDDQFGIDWKRLTFEIGEVER